MILFILSFLIISSIVKAAMDVVLFHPGKSVFDESSDWLNPAKSWRNKWKNGDPAQGEKFLGSSTVFVWLTDFWHLAQMLYLSCWQLAVALLMWQSLDAKWWVFPLLFAGLKIIYSSVFELFFSKLFKK